MPPSQLKQLKTSLRESGVLGPQQSKKQKKQKAGGSKKSAATANRDDRAKRNAALASIREQFNPFEIKASSARGSKYDVTTRTPDNPVRHRPGVTKGLGEEKVCVIFFFLFFVLLLLAFVSTGHFLHSVLHSVLC